MPGADQRKLSKSITSNADTVILDIEDGVALNRKQAARDLISNHLSQAKYEKSNEIAVRMNSIGSGKKVETVHRSNDKGLEQDDLNLM